MKFSVTVEVSLRPGVADPQGATIERACPALGFDGISGVRVGKMLRFDVEGSDRSAVESEVADLAARFLTNPVIEDCAISVTEAG